MRTFNSRQERGDTLVEFALTLTLFLMTLLGTMEFGIGVFRYNVISNLAQEGARYASVRGQNSGAMAASEASVRSFVAARSLGISSTSDVDVFKASSANVCTSTHVNPSTLIGGTGVCVKVRHSFAPLTRIVPMATLTFSSTAQMIMTR